MTDAARGTGDESNLAVELHGNLLNFERVRDHSGERPLVRSLSTQNPGQRSELPLSCSHHRAYVRKPRHKEEGPMRLPLISPSDLTSEQRPIYEDMRGGIEQHFQGF